MKSAMFSALRLGWIVLAVLVLTATLYFFDGKPNSDADTLLAYGMLILAFPVSLVVAFVAGLVGWAAYEVLGVIVPVTYLTILFGWLIVFVAGYWQWFVLLPRVISTLRARRAGLKARSS
jgi:hypothetical protein